MAQEWWEHGQGYRAQITTFQVREEPSEHAVYNIIVRYASGEHRDWLVVRRYSQFESLYQKVASKLPEAFVFPEKKWFGNLDDEFLEERKTGLQLFLNVLLALDGIWRNYFVQMFLDPSIKEGFCYLNDVKEHWMVLRPNSLAYYLTPHDPVPVGQFPILDIVEVVPRTSTQGMKLPGMAISHGKSKKNMLFTAQTTDDRDLWIQSILRARDKRKEYETQKQSAPTSGQVTPTSLTPSASSPMVNSWAAATTPSERKGDTDSAFVAGRNGSCDSSRRSSKRLSHASPGSGDNLPGYQMGKVLGMGLFGEVRSAISVENGGFVAVKQISKATIPPHLHQPFMESMHGLTKLKHRNLVSLLCVSEGPSCFYLVNEYVDDRSLLNMIVKFGYKFPENLLLKCLMHILHGLSYLHSLPAVHGHLNCANVLITKEGVAKLSDFGLWEPCISHLQEADLAILPWLAPELVEDTKSLSPAADIWSLGCTVIEMFCGKAPFVNLPAADLRERLLDATPPPPPRDMSPFLTELVMRCCQPDVEDRPDAFTLLADLTATLDEQALKDEEAAKAPPEDAVSPRTREKLNKRGTQVVNSEPKFMGAAGPNVAYQHDPAYYDALTRGVSAQTKEDVLSLVFSLERAVLALAAGIEAADMLGASQEAASASQLAVQLRKVGTAHQLQWRPGPSNILAAADRTQEAYKAFLRSSVASRDVRPQPSGEGEAAPISVRASAPQGFLAEHLRGVDLTQPLARPLARPTRGTARADPSASGNSSTVKLRARVAEQKQGGQRTSNAFSPEQMDMASDSEFDDD